jgi:hypothetical protein
MPGEPGQAPPPAAVEVWPSVAPFGEAGRISVSIIVLAFLCSSAGSTFASPDGKNHTWPPTAQTTGLDQVSDPGIAAPPVRRSQTSAAAALRAVEQCRRPSDTYGQQPAARCVAPSKCCPGTAVGRHRDLPHWRPSSHGPGLHGKRAAAEGYLHTRSCRSPTRRPLPDMRSLRPVTLVALLCVLAKTWDCQVRWAGLPACLR